MRIKLVCVGKPRGPMEELSATFEKRIRRYAQLDVATVAEEKYRGTPSAGEIQHILAAEAERIRGALNPRHKVTVLDSAGRQLTSEELAHELAHDALHGRNDVAFVVGGSLGLDDAFKTQADMRLSLSCMTFPHQLARVVLLEQIYRAFTISKGEPYHK